MSIVNVQVRARRNESTENLIKRFSRKIKREGIIEEIRNRRFYEKPSVKKRRKKIRRKRILNKLFNKAIGE
jgi:small subunit ribosomal protein S21